MRSLSVFVSALLAIGGFATPASASSHEVRCVPSTSVEAGCTSGYATIQAAIDASDPGDEVVVGDGTYSESLVLWKNGSGVVLDGLTLRAAAGATPELVSVVDARCTSTPTTLVPGRSAIQVGHADGVTIEGLDITSSNLGGEDESVIAISGDVDGLTIRGNTLRDENDGIQFRDSCMPGTYTNAVIEDNHIVHTGACVKAQDIVGLIVRNNTMDNCTEYAIVLETLNASMEIRDVQVTGNRIYNIRHGVKGYGGVWVGRRTGGTVTDVSVHRNEIFALNDGNAITLARGMDDVRVTHNTIYDNGLDNDSSAIVLYDPSYAANPFTNLFVVNNAIVSSGAGIQLKRVQLDATSVFDHNAFWDIRTQTYWNDESDPVSFTFIQGPNDVHGQIEFIAPGDDLSADLSPLCNSVSVDAGLDYGQTEPKVGSAYDIGALEGCAWLTEYSVDCDAWEDDIAAVQGGFRALSRIAPSELLLSGVCDFAAAPAAGGDFASIAHAAVVVPDDVMTTIRPADPAAPATIRGGGEEAAFLFPPGNSKSGLTDLRFEDVAHAAVAWNSNFTTIAGNDIGVTGTSSAPIFAIGNDRSSTTPGSVAVTHGADTSQGTTFPTDGRLTDLFVTENTVLIRIPFGSRPGDSVAIDVRQRNSGDIQRVAITDNAVGLFSPAFPSFNQNGIRVMAHAGDPNFHVKDVLISGNNLGRLENLAVPIPEADQIHAAGRAGVVVVRATDFEISDNDVRAIVTGTGVAMPGGGIVVSDSADGVIQGNDIIEVTDDLVRDADLGAIAVIDDIMVLFGSPAGGTSTRNILVRNNFVGKPAGSTPGLSGRRGLVLNNASQVSTAGGNEFHGIRDRTILIGATLAGPGAMGTGATLSPAGVKSSFLCGNLTGTSMDSPTSVRFVQAVGSVGNTFPAGHLYTNNARCP